MALIHEERRDGRAVVLITHDLSLVADHATRVIALADGVVAFDGTPDELFARPDLLERCGLALPAVAAAFALARASRPDLPAIIGLSAARSALAGARLTAA